MITHLYHQSPHNLHYIKLTKEVMEQLCGNWRAKLKHLGRVASVCSLLAAHTTSTSTSTSLSQVINHNDHILSFQNHHHHTYNPHCLPLFLHLYIINININIIVIMSVDPLLSFIIIFLMIVEYLVRFPKPLAFGSVLGERTPKKVIF